MVVPDFECRHALLLQGPAGPFFRRFAEELRHSGVQVTKVNLHAGDRLFYPGPAAVDFRGSLAEWPAWIRALMRDASIDAMFVFGDCRPYHRTAIAAAGELGVMPWVFEEGYLRPDYITLERGGVNGHSLLPTDPDFYRRRAEEEPDPEPAEPVGPSFGISAWYSALNALAFTMGRRTYPEYQHHRPLNAWKHTAWWLRGGARKVWFSLRERGALQRLTAASARPYFFVPLQVHCDFQLLHSPYDDIRDFIEEVVTSFASHAPNDHVLVLKHHPMDRPFREYGPYLRELAVRRGVVGRLHYLHDVHLPTLVKHAQGTVTINSTVGLSSIHHGTPVKVLGTAVYDLPGMCFRGSLDDFWRTPGAVDVELYEAFRKYLLLHNQANGNFYRRLPSRRDGAGVQWFPLPPPADRSELRSDRNPPT